jgi:hypothetical protein
MRLILVRGRIWRLKMKLNDAGNKWPRCQTFQVELR